MIYELPKNHVALTSGDVVKKVCEPLLQFDITHVNYRRSYNNGDRVILSTDPNWLEHYYKTKKYHQLKTFEAKNEIITQHFSYNLWTNLMHDQSFAEIFLHGKSGFNIDHGITLSYRNENFIELFHFGTTRENYHLIPFYLNNIDLLEKFTLYFKDKLHNLIKISDNIRINTGYEIYEPRIKTQTQYDYYAKYGEKNIFSLDIKSSKNRLSQRETQCILLLLKGKPLRIIADILGVAQCTVETIINNVKIKSNCSSKIELLNTFSASFLENKKTGEIIRLQPKNKTTQKTKNSNPEIKNFLQQTVSKRLYLQHKNNEFYLTKKEAKILLHICNNQTAKQIGKILNISYRTVEYHEENIRKKCRINSKHELISFIIRNYMLDKIKNFLL